MKIKVPANLGPIGNMSLFPSYLSNGHWALAKHRIENWPMMETETTAKVYFPKRYTLRVQSDDSPIHAINNKIENAQLYTATAYLQDCGKNGLHRFFINAQTGELVQFNCAYLKLFGLDNKDGRLFGSSPKSAFRDTQEGEDMSVLIMPKLFEAEGLTVFQATLRGLETISA